MKVASTLTLFTTALVLAVVAGWGLGRLVGPAPFLADPAPPAPASTSGDHGDMTPAIPLEQP
jgi:hypothetical protein